MTDFNLEIASAVKKTFDDSRQFFYPLAIINKLKGLGIPNAEQIPYLKSKEEFELAFRKIRKSVNLSLAQDMELK
jgi:hypothetical protein